MEKKKKKKKGGKKKKAVKFLTDDAENSSAVSYLHYAASRGKTLEYMLHYPISSRPTYLLEENSLNLKKSDKSKLI